MVNLCKKVPQNCISKNILQKAISLLHLFLRWSQSKSLVNICRHFSLRLSTFSPALKFSRRHSNQYCNLPLFFVVVSINQKKLCANVLLSAVLGFAQPSFKNIFSKSVVLIDKVYCEMKYFSSNLNILILLLLSGKIVTAKMIEVKYPENKIY